MKMVQAQKIDSFHDYAIVDATIPVPGDGEVLIRVAACGMGYVDALVAQGGYQMKPPLPFTPGQETGGIVEALGPNVTGLHIGDRVMASTFGGGLAQFAAVPSTAVFPIPDTMSFRQAAIFRINYLTAIHALIDRAAIQAGEKLLVFGSAGGVGLAAVQIAAILGAEVVAVASSEEKRGLALSRGAGCAIDTDAEGWRDRLKLVTGGKGPDVILDPVCGPLFESAFRSLAWRGRHLVVGFAGGPFPSLPVNLPLMKGAALIGVDVRQFLLYEEERARNHIETLLGWVSNGKLDPVVGRRFPVAEFREAMEFALTGQALGKSVIEFFE